MRHHRDDDCPSLLLDRATRAFRTSYGRDPLGVAAWMRHSYQWVVQDVGERGVDYVHWPRPRDMTTPPWLDRLGALLHGRLPRGTWSDYWETIPASSRSYLSGAAMSLASRRLPCCRQTHPHVRGLLPHHWTVQARHATFVTSVTVDVLRAASLGVVPRGWWPPRSERAVWALPTSGPRARP